MSENKIVINTQLVSEKILATSKIEELSIQLNYGSNVFKYKVQSVIDSVLSIRSEGTFDIVSPIFRASIDKATVTYKKYKLTNQGSLKFSFSKDKVEFEQFVLRRKKKFLEYLVNLVIWGIKI